MVGWGVAVELRGWSRTIQLVAWNEGPSEGMLPDDARGLSALELRAHIVEDPRAARALRALLGSSVGEELDDDSLCARILDAVERGRVRVYARPYNAMSSHHLEQAELERDLLEFEDYESADHWVEIELLDEDDQPVVGERCRIVLPDDREVITRTDKDGLVRVDRIIAGQCLVYFPDLDTEAAAPLVPLDDWIELELLDDEDQPVVGERCRIVLPDGRELSSRSDKNGLVRVERCPSGQCQIYFPDLDADVIAPLH